MFLARVQGRVVSTAKEVAMVGSRLLIVEPMRVNYDADQAMLEVTGRAIVAVDQLGAGDGQLVLITQGSSARMADGCAKMPIDAAVVGIVDEAVVQGHNVTGSK